MRVHCARVCVCIYMYTHTLHVYIPTILLFSLNTAEDPEELSYRVSLTLFFSALLPSHFSTSKITMRRLDHALRLFIPSTTIEETLSLLTESCGWRMLLDFASSVA